MTHIRPAILKDVPALAHLLAQLFSQEAEFAPDLAAQARGLSLIIGEPNTGRILIAERDGKPVGMVNLLYTVSTALGERGAILEDMVVDKTCRGGGIGAMLLAKAIEAARADGCRRITLLSDHDNHRAHAFYGRFGFQRSAMVPFRLALERSVIV